MDAEGANLRRLTFEGDYNDGAAWSPDGTRIAYASRRSGRFDIALTDVVTLESRLLTSGPGSNETPVVLTRRQADRFRLQTQKQSLRDPDLQDRIGRFRDPAADQRWKQLLTLLVRVSKIAWVSY